MPYSWKPLLLLLLPYLSFCQAPFDCNGRIFRVLEEQGGSTFQEIRIDYDNQKAEFEDLAFFSGLQLNGMCYRPADNLIYGVQLGPEYKLFQLDANFSLQTLAPLPLPTNLLFVAGDISPDERYLVLLGFSLEEPGNLLALVDLESETYETTLLPLATTGSESSIACADIAFHPSTNILYGYDHSGQRLSTIDINRRLIDNTSYPRINSPKGNVPSLFFDAFGNLFGIGSAESTLTNRSLFRFDTNTGKSTLYQNYGYERNQDGCSCPYRIHLLNRVSRREAFPCTQITFTLTMINRSPAPQTGINLRDTFPEGSYIVSIEENLSGGIIESGVGSNILYIRDIRLPVGKDSIRIVLNLEEGIPGGPVYNRAILDNVGLASNAEASEILSDDPTTVAFNDPTLFTIRPLDINFGDGPFVICAGQSLVLDPGINGAETYEWSTGSREPTLEVEAPGYYGLTVSTPCGFTHKEVWVSEDNLYLELGPDIIAEPGESLVLAPDIQSSSPLAYLFWSENSGHTLSCNTCETPEVFPLETGLYRLEISNLNGCTAEDNLSIIVLPFHYYAPTAFSPNGDQINDLFLLYGRRDFAIRHFRVFDRWGNLACHKEQMRANDPSTGWNGAFNGKPLNSGVYVWTAEAVLSNGNPINISGEVHLIR